MTTENQTPGVPYNLATDPKKSHKERILAYLETRKGAEKVKLNDFLKSLWPVIKNEPPEFSKQENMRVLRKELMELKATGDIVFMDDAFLRLGKPYWPGTSGVTKYYDLSNLTIEAVLSQNG